MSTIQICAVGIIAVFAVLLLRDSGSPHPEWVVLVLALLVMGRAAVNVGEVVSFVSEVSDGTSVSEYVRTLLKAAGIAFICDFTAGICRDAGEGNIAQYVEIAGKTELCVLILPIVGELLDISFGMLEL